MRFEFYERIPNQKDQTEYLLQQLREFLDPASSKINFYLPQVRPVSSSRSRPRTSLTTVPMST